MFFTQRGDTYWTDLDAIWKFPIPTVLAEIQNSLRRYKKWEIHDTMKQILLGQQV